MKRIAVVEDNPDNRLLVRVILESRYQVIDYENGGAALAGLRQEKPDLVLLDVSLPEMDGTEVLRRIRAEPSLRDLPVIALTAHAMAGDREKLLASGFDDYLTKPIEDETLLLRAIERLLCGNAARAAGGDQPRSLDAAALQRLQRLGDDAFVCKMIEVFLDYAGRKIAEARAAQAAGNLNGVERAVHPLKSSAGNLGADHVRRLAVRIEELAEQGRGETLSALLNELEQAFAVLRPELEEARRRLTAKAP
jgi:two-component system cell cycle response regulator DivK